MIFSIFVNWKIAKTIDTIHDHNDKNIRKAHLIIAISFNLCLLIFFKYISFIVIIVEQYVGETLPYAIILKKIPLPIGISFYSFQAISYVIDVYRKRVPHESNLFDMGAYISMFPQLIAGPIVRYEQIKKELHGANIEISNVIIGSKLFIIGFASKVLIANSFATSSDYIFSLDASYLSILLAWAGAISYFFQIYFDFNGYSVMAIGLGRILGFSFPRNFDRPYISRSMTEFWRRWHISLSSWFKDYLYISLGGNRGSTIKTYRNLLIVFILCGIWHGAGWNFLLWGIYHGVFLVIERFFRNTTVKIPNYISHCYSICTVLIGWVVFRCESFIHLKAYLTAMLGLSKKPVFLFEEISVFFWTILVFFAVIASCVKINYEYPPILNKNSTISFFLYSLIFLTCILFLVCRTYNPFIYFRF